MGRLLKYVFYLALLGAVGFVGYALVADLPARQSEIVKDVPLHFTD